jgi:SAM-dependent methyltransferase
MYACVDPLLEAYGGAKWLTVGDGRYGKDAKYIEDKGGDALASDISDHLLKEALENQYIKAYSKENAECLSFPAESFDFVFCKESYHHFPRPMVALYEMIRVVKTGVALVEPQEDDSLLGTKRLIWLLLRQQKRILKGLISRRTSSSPATASSTPINANYETEGGGNYVYKLSRNELVKVCLGLDFPYIAFKGLNDCYFKGVELEKIADNGPLFKKVKKQIRRLDMRCSLGINGHGLLAAVIFKNAPSQDCMERLRVTGYEVLKLPRNPCL